LGQLSLTHCSRTGPGPSCTPRWRWRRGATCQRRAEPQAWRPGRGPWQV